MKGTWRETIPNFQIKYEHEMKSSSEQPKPVQEMPYVECVSFKNNLRFGQNATIL